MGVSERERTASESRPALSDGVLAWSFVLIWGSGYLASKTGLQSAPPFTLLTLRFGLGMLCVIPLVLLVRPRWPSSWRETFHVCVAGLLMHALNLGGSHSAQYLGASAGNVALILALQPLLTAAFARRRLGERLNTRSWLGVAMGFGGVALVVWPRVQLDLGWQSLLAVSISLLSITVGTLYQRAHCSAVDLRAAMPIQFGISLVVLVPLAWWGEGFAVHWNASLFGSLIFLVIFSSIFATNALHLLMRRGQATRVTSLLFLTPVVAVALEWALFSVVPGTMAAVGIVIACSGVALVSRRA